MGGGGGGETGRKGSGKGAGGVREAGEEGGGKWDSQGGGKREKKGKIMQRCAIFCIRKNAKRREPKNKGREPILKGTESGRFKPPCPPPPTPQPGTNYLKKNFSYSEAKLWNSLSHDL